MIAKDMMPWLFVSRKSAWTPFAKVRREGWACRRLKAGRPGSKKKALDPKGSRAFLGLAGA